MFIKTSLLSLLFFILTVGSGTNLAFALGDYNYVPMYREVPFNFAENYTGTLSIGFWGYRFNDRIIEVVDDSKYVNIMNQSPSNVQIVDYKISVRKINDYYVNISGVVQLRVPMSNSEYYYATIRIYKDLY